MRVSCLKVAVIMKKMDKQLLM